MNAVTWMSVATINHFHDVIYQPEVLSQQNARLHTIILFSITQVGNFVSYLSRQKHEEYRFG
jgi:hypothetical protein